MSIDLNTHHDCEIATFKLLNGTKFKSEQSLIFCHDFHGYRVADGDPKALQTLFRMMIDIFNLHNFLYVSEWNGTRIVIFI